MSAENPYVLTAFMCIQTTIQYCASMNLYKCSCALESNSEDNSWKKQLVLKYNSDFYQIQTPFFFFVGSYRKEKVVSVVHSSRYMIWNICKDKDILWIILKLSNVCTHTRVYISPHELDVTQISVNS